MYNGILKPTGRALKMSALKFLSYTLNNNKTKNYEHASHLLNETVLQHDYRLIFKK